LSRFSLNGLFSRSTLLRSIACLSACSSLFLASEPLAQGGSAVITLVMPVGARQLGMGETAVAIADDVFGTFWNPAGLSFGPVAHEWDIEQTREQAFKAERLHLPQSGELKFTAIAAKPKTGFLVKSEVWTGSTHGLMHYDGRNWHRDHIVILEDGDNIGALIRRYVGTGDNMDSLVAWVKTYNDVKTKEDEAELISLHIPYDLVFRGQAITTMVLDNKDFLWVGTPKGLFRFDGQGWKSFDKEEGFTYIPTDTVRASVTEADTTKKDSTLAASDTTKADSAFKVAVPRKNEVVTDSNSAVARGGIFRSLEIHSLAVKGNSIWVGTNDGLYEYRMGAMVRRGQTLLPSQNIQAIALNDAANEVFIALNGKGIARYTPAKTQNGAAKWKLYGVADGLMDSSTTAMVLDRFGHVYSAHRGGISHFTGAAWERVHFKNQDVTSLSLDEANNLWIGTNEGAWKHAPYYANPKGRSVFSRSKDAPEEDKAANKRGTWSHFHTGNGLHDKHVLAVQTQGADVWFLTDAGVERYNDAKSQVGFFYEALLPVLGLKDLYHVFAGGSFPIEDWGTLGGFMNYVSFGQNVTTDASGGDGQTFDAYELVGGLSYATRITHDLGLGVTAKFIYSALAQGVTSTGEKTDGIARSYALDIGLLQKNLWLKGFSVGFVMQNMGPAVFYVDQAQSDPIPFTWKLGLAYEVFHTADHRLTVGSDVSREAIYRNGSESAPFWEGAWKSLAYPYEQRSHGIASTWAQNARLSVFNFGAEYSYANVVAVRSGYLLDDSGQRYELDLGLGFMISDILQIDGAFIRTSGGVRNNQQRYAMIMRF
jgi:hypothetical protein